MEEEVAGLRAALERLQVRHDGTVRELRERCGRNEREHRQERDRLQRRIDELQRQMKQSFVGRDDDDTALRRETAALHGRLDRVMAEQSLLWNRVGRITATATDTDTDIDDPAAAAAVGTAVHPKPQQQPRKKVVRQEPLPKLPSSSPPQQQQQHQQPHDAESPCYVNKKQLNYELERLMQIWKAQMGDLASFFHTSLDEAKVSIDRARAETRFLVDAALQRNHQQSQRQYETLSQQMANHTQSIAEVREDQEVSNMALIDTMSCMKTKFDAVLEELHLYGTLPHNSLITNTEGETTTTTTTSSGNSGHSGIGRNGVARTFFQQQQQQYHHNKNDHNKNDHNKNLTAPQIFERKTGQWHAQFKSLRAELRAIRRENADQRQDVDEVKLLLETSVNVLCQQAETTASLCEKQLRRLHEHVRRDCVTMNQLRDTVRTEAQETDRPWRDRFRELLHALQYHHEQHQTQNNHRGSGATLRVTDSMIVASPRGGRGGGGGEAAAASDSRQPHQPPSSPGRDPASRTHEPTRLLLPPSAQTTTRTSGGVLGGSTITSFRCKTDATLVFASPSHEYVDKATVTQTKKKQQQQEKEKDRRRGDATDPSSSDAGGDEAGEDDTCEVMTTASMKITVEAHLKHGIIDLTGISEERDDVESEANMLPPQQ